MEEAGSGRLNRSSTARRERAGAIAGRIFRGSQRKRPTRRHEREAFRANFAAMMPEILEAAQARGLEADEAAVYAHADTFAERSYDAQGPSSRVRSASLARGSRTGAPAVIAGRAPRARARRRLTIPPENHHRRRPG